MKRIICALICVAASASGQSAPAAAGAPVSAKVREFLKLRFGLFLHFNMGTFAGKEWANGYEDPAIFNPRKLDCRQWADAARAAGMKYAVLTAKHTGGWCLWDSAHTTHDITSFRNYKDGKGDIVREFVNAFRSRGLKVGLYYCFPGDFSLAKHKNEVPEGKPDLHGLPIEAAGDYVGFMKKQLTELLRKYGKIDVLWIDQYRNKYTRAQWPEILAHVRSLAPQCVVVGNNAPTLAESDVLSFEYPWNPKRLPPEGNSAPSEICDTLSKRGWFWKPATLADLKSAADVVEMLRFANARSANYLLNVAPDRDGLISNPELERMREIGRLLGVK